MRAAAGRGLQSEVGWRDARLYETAISNRTTFAPRGRTWDADLALDDHRFLSCGELLSDERREFRLAVRDHPGPLPEAPSGRDVIQWFSTVASGWERL
jgi:hypothetical protein